MGEEGEGGIRTVEGGVCGKGMEKNFDVVKTWIK